MCQLFCKRAQINTFTTEIGILCFSECYVFYLFFGYISSAVCLLEKKECTESRLRGNDKPNYC